MKRETLVLVDAYSQIFRSFYAIRRLTNARGEVVNAAFVFTKLLLQLEKKHSSEYGAMLFDCGKVSFRLELNPEYKANRPPMPDDLRSQIPLIRKIAEAFGWQLLQCENFEADDLIGGLSAKYKDLPVEIVSSDKDLSQLIDQRVSMLVPASGGFEKRSEKEVVEKFGVAPAEIIDYLALIGDTSDNIPGVPGIGPKSAVEILHTFGPAESWLNDPSLIDAEHKLAKKLLPALDIVRKNRELIRLRTELPETLNQITPPLRKEPDWESIRNICQDNQFKSILNELPPLVIASGTENAFEECDLFAYAATNHPNIHDAQEEATEVQGELF